MIRVVMLALAVVVSGLQPAAAADFAGKTITLLIPFPTGGGQDLWARFNAPLLAKHLPGKPTIIIKNSPGGGSIAGTNLYAQTAKPDGMMLLGVSASTQFPYLLGDARVKYDYKDWTIVLAGPTGGVAYMSTKFGVKSAADLPKLKDQELHFPSQGATSLDLVPLLGLRLLGLNVKHVFGVPGRTEARLGFERGEFTIDHQTTSGYLRSTVNLVKSGLAVPLFSWGAVDANGKLIRDPNFPDMPNIAEAYEMVHGKKPSGVEWEAFESFLISGFPAQKLIVLPKETPADIVEAYRAAARAMFKDPDYLAKRDEIIGEYEQVTDDAAVKLYQVGTRISPEAAEWTRDFLTKNYQQEFK
jgi:hypothetical protein